MPGQWAFVPFFKSIEAFSFEPEFSGFNAIALEVSKRYLHIALRRAGFQTVTFVVKPGEYEGWLDGRSHSDEALLDFMQSRWNRLSAEVGEYEARKILKSWLRT